MTLFFDLEKLEKLAIKIPYMVVLEKYAIPGSSFLLNPEPLFRSNEDILYKMQYVRLAAKRDYFFYTAYRSTTLPLLYFPDIRINSIKNNALLNIKDNQIYFLYEEEKPRIIKWH